MIHPRHTICTFYTKIRETKKRKLLMFLLYIVASQLTVLSPHRSGFPVLNICRYIISLLVTVNKCFRERPFLHWGTFNWPVCQNSFNIIITSVVQEIKTICSCIVSAIIKKKMVHFETIYNKLHNFFSNIHVVMLKCENPKTVSRSITSWIQYERLRLSMLHSFWLKWNK